MLHDAALTALNRQNTKLCCYVLVELHECNIALRYTHMAILMYIFI